jgi:hypothetical protein
MSITSAGTITERSMNVSSSSPLTPSLVVGFANATGHEVASADPSNIVKLSDSGRQNRSAEPYLNEALGVGGRRSVQTGRAGKP